MFGIKIRKFESGNGYLVERRVIGLPLILLAARDYDKRLAYRTGLR